MKVLSIIAQKPSSTGSGVYLAELVRCFDELGIDQEVICAKYLGDEIHFPDKVRCHSLTFDTDELPIKIAGMSDVMPYESIRYSELASDENKLKIWASAFEELIDRVLEDFKLDLIVCHHLYLLTAIVSSKTDIPIHGICHNTDLRQYRQTDLKRDFIKENILKLKKIFAPSLEHAEIIKEIYGVSENKIDVIGIGYNDQIFYDRKIRNTNDSVSKLLYVGKVAKKKGVLSLVKAINLLIEANEQDIYILSAYLNDTAKQEKIDWLNKYLPAINDEKMLFVPYGTDKSEYVLAATKQRSDRDILLDDFTFNLKNWHGIGVKLLNKINNTKRSWNGFVTNGNADAWTIYTSLKGISYATS